MGRSAVRPPERLVASARQLARRDNVTNFGFIAGDWVVIAVAVVTAHLVGGPVLDALALLVIGSRMRGLANLMHEASHHKLFRNRRLNAAAGRVLCAWPIAESLGVYTREHHRHHRLLWISEDDPDRRLYRLTGTETPTRERMGFRRFVCSQVVLVVLPWQPFRRLVSDWRILSRGLVLTAVATVVWLIAPTAGTLFAFFWVLPWLTTYQIIGYWAELAEHGGLWAKGWDWGSRNWSGGPLTRWLLAAHATDLYHLAHHWFPAVPHWRLARLDQECRALWPDYAKEMRCSGFFVSTRDGRTSVLRDIWTGGEVLPATAQHLVAPHGAQP